MGYLDTWCRPDANYKARKLGAVTFGVATYPDTRAWSVEKGTHTAPGLPFAIHYFNEEGNELAYWLIDLKSFVVLGEPRVWDPCMKPAISPIPTTQD